MDCADTFNKLLEKLGLPMLVQTQLKLREFTTAASLYWALSMGAEETFEAILNDGLVEAGSAPNLLSTPTAGKLRRLLKECEKLCETAGAETPSSELALPAASSNNQLIDLGPKLSVVTLAKLWDDFSKHYPAEVLCDDVRPCRELVQSIYVQKSHNELKFIPWKHITSEVQADREKQTSQKKEESVHEMTALSCVLGEGYPQRSSASNLPRCKRPLAFSLLNFVQKFANKVFGSLPFSVVKFRHLQFQTCTVFT